MSLRILVVERERHAREGLRTILSSDGYDVCVAEDMWVGFASIFAQTFDVLLLDDDVRPERHVTLNVLDLLRFARRYRPATSGIVLSSFAEDVPRYMTEDGVQAVLEKPVDFSRLRDELAALTSRQGRRSVR